MEIWQNLIFWVHCQNLNFNSCEQLQEKYIWESTHGTNKPFLLNSPHCPGEVLRWMDPILELEGLKSTARLLNSDRSRRMVALPMVLHYSG